MIHSLGLYSTEKMLIMFESSIRSVFSNPKIRSISVSKLWEPYLLKLASTERYDWRVGHAFNK